MPAGEKRHQCYDTRRAMRSSTRCCVRWGDDELMIQEWLRCPSACTILSSPYGCAACRQRGRYDRLAWLGGNAYGGPVCLLGEAHDSCERFVGKYLTEETSSGLNPDTEDTWLDVSCNGIFTGYLCADEYTLGAICVGTIETTNEEIFGCDSSTTSSSGGSGFARHRRMGHANGSLIADALAQGETIFHEENSMVLDLSTASHALLTPVHKYSGAGYDSPLWKTYSTEACWGRFEAPPHDFAFG